MNNTNIGTGCYTFSTSPTGKTLYRSAVVVAETKTTVTVKRAQTETTPEVELTFNKSRTGAGVYKNPCDPQQISDSLYLRGDSNAYRRTYLTFDLKGVEGRIARSRENQKRKHRTEALELINKAADILSTNGKYQEGDAVLALISTLRASLTKDIEG